MEEHNANEWAKALLIIYEVTTAIERGVKHYNREGKLLTTPLEVIETLYNEGSVTFDTPEAIARRN